jgi:glucokinase
MSEKSGTDLSAIRSSALASAIKDGDVAIEGIIRRAAHDLGIAIASVVNLLAPDVVVLGGGLVEAMPRLYVEEVRRAVREQAMRTYAQSTRVLAAKLGDEATVMGAAALAAEAAVAAKRRS